MNRGLVSPLALARLDIKRLALAADIQTNWMSQTLGPMMFRPGLGYIGSTLNNDPALQVDFQFSQDDTAICELTRRTMRVRVNDVVVTRPAVNAVFSDWNGASYDAGVSASSSFPDVTDLNKWHDNDDAGGASTLASGGGLQLLGTGTAAAIRDRKIVHDGAKEHGITIVVARGQATCRVGTTEGGDELLQDRTLRAGTHSLGITPGAEFYIRLSNSLSYAAVVSSVTIEQAGGDMAITTPWSASDLDFVRWDQSGDVIFLACKGNQQKRIERLDRTSSPPSRCWGVVEYAPADGPFGTLNTGPVQLKGSALSGEITLTANQSFFRTSHVGGLFRLSSAGQQVSQEITTENSFTNFIKVTGVGSTARSFQLDLTGPTFSGSTTVTLQRSIATPGAWTDVAGYNGTTSVSIYDNLDNQITYYRVGVKTGNFTALDDLTAALTFSAGSIDGIVRVTDYTNGTTVSASVLSPLGAANTYTGDWNEGDWSPKNGYPSGVALADGRMCWAGKGMEWLSVSDEYDSFSDDSANLGDSSAIRRFIGSGPVDDVSWLMALNFLLVGTAGNILVAKSSAIDEPLTPTKFSLKPVASTGAAPVRPLKVDTNGIYVSRNGSRIYQLSADANLYSIVPYAPTELTILYPTIGVPGLVRCGVQRHPNTRLHYVRSDGKVVVVVFDKAEEVTCLLLIETDGIIEDVCVLPGTTAAPAEDQVYYTVKRTINGSIVRYLEKWALESQAVGATDNRMADSFVTVTGAGSTLSAPHLAGEQVVVWLDGVCPIVAATGRPKLYTVAGDGTITLDTPFTSFACAGLPYIGRWRSAKLAVGSQMQAPLTMFKSISEVGFVLANTHPRGLSYGEDFNFLDDLPLVGNEGELIDVDAIFELLDLPPVPVDGTWSSDARLCLEARAPLPATVMGVNVVGEGHDRA